MLKFLKDFGSPTAVISSRKLEVSQEDFNRVQSFLDKKLLPIWEWLLGVMDSTEAQLRFGGSLTSDAPGHPQNHVRNHGRMISSSHVGWSWSTRPPPSSSIQSSSTEQRTNRDDPSSARREFLSYSLSLMRAHNAEHLDSLPVIDVSSLKHIAYVFDALIFLCELELITCQAQKLRLIWRV